MNKIKFIITIIIIVFIIFFFIDPKNNVKSKKKLALGYQEKISDLTIYKFDKNNNKQSKTVAKSYIKFENADDALTHPVIHNYIDDYKITANSSKILNNGKFKFTGNVKIVSENKLGYNLTSEILFIDDKNKLIYSDEKSLYSNKNSNIFANSFYYEQNLQIMKLSKGVKGYYD